MLDYDELAFQQDKIDDGLREIGYALESVKGLGLTEVEDALKEARDKLEDKSSEIEKQMHEAKKEEAKRGEYGYFDGWFAETRNCSFFKEYLEG